MNVALAQQGLRERGKAERLSRLRLAALQVFREKGFDAATTREIALAAGVSVGTLFTYAHDKRDLLFMVLNDDLDAVLAGALVASRRPGVLLDQLLALLGPIYGYFAADPMLGRAMMREVAYFDMMSLGAGNLGAGEQALRYLRRMEAWRAGIQGVLDRGAAAGQWNASVATAPWSDILWSLHLVEVRRWIDGVCPTAANGKACLRAVFGLVLGGGGLAMHRAG